VVAFGTYLANPDSDKPSVFRLRVFNGVCSMNRVREHCSLCGQFMPHAGEVNTGIGTGQTYYCRRCRVGRTVYRYEMDYHDKPDRFKRDYL